MTKINALQNIRVYSFAVVQFIQRGSYRLIETTGYTKILRLDNKKMFAWVTTVEIEEILVATHKALSLSFINISFISCVVMGYYRK